MTSRDTLVAELKALRQRGGLTLTRLEGCPAVMAALHADTASAAMNLLVERLEGLRQDRSVTALKYAYGILGSQHTLKSRRDEFVATLDEWRSHDTVETWEDQAIGELAIRLSVASIAESRFRALVIKADIQHDRIAGFHEYLIWRSSGEPQLRDLRAREHFQFSLPVKSWMYQVPDISEDLDGLIVSLHIKRPDGITIEDVYAKAQRYRYDFFDLYDNYESAPLPDGFNLSGFPELRHHLPDVLRVDFAFPQPWVGQHFLFYWG